jgi:TIR domain
LSPRPHPPLVVFYAYSRDDEPHLTQLRRHVSLLRRQKKIDDWHDREILPGGEWEPRLDEQFEKADIVILLVSPSFIASDYCWGVEMKRALKRQRNGQVVVIPVIVRPTENWYSAPFGHLQALPRDGKAVTEWPSRDRAWANVAEGIRLVVEHWGTV